jgi:hypothetical protein
MGLPFRDWKDSFCADREDCTIEEAVYKTIYTNMGEQIDLLESSIDDFVRDVLEMEWIRPNLIEIKPGYRKNLQRHLEQLGRTDEQARLVAKDVQTFLNKTQQAQLVYKGILEWYELALKEREARIRSQQELENRSISGLYRTGLLFPTFTDIIGEYSIPHSDFSFIVTNDPPEILFKSQGRPWEGNSCERFTGVYKEGFRTDIAWGNLIVFIYDKYGVAVARKMLRWAYGPNREVGLNMEPLWYYAPDDKTQELYDIVDDLLCDLIADFNYYVPRSITPYIYLGFSDFIGLGGERINYIGPGKIHVDPDRPYLVHYPPIEHGRVQYNQTDLVDATTITQSEIKHLLNNGFTWADLKEAGQYIINYMEHDYLGEIEIIQTEKDLENCIVNNIVAYTIDDLPKYEQGEWVIDETSPGYRIATPEDDELFHNQALKLMKAFRLVFHNYKFYYALFRQYYIPFMTRNKYGGLYTDAIATRWSWIGTLDGGVIFFDKTRRCLVSMDDSVYLSDVVAPFIKEKGSSFLDLRNQEY